MPPGYAQKNFKLRSRPSITGSMCEPPCVLRLEGDFAIGGAAELKGRLLEALSSGQGLELDMALAGDMDITTIQLIWAAAHEAERLGTSFEMTGLVPEGIRSTFIDAGFASFLALVSSGDAFQEPPATRTEGGDDRQV